MNSLATSTFGRISSLLKTTACSSRQRRPLIQLYVTCSQYKSPAATSGLACLCESIGFQLCSPKPQPAHLREYSSASEAQRKNDSIKRKVRSLLEEEQPSGGAKRSNDLSLDEKSKASSLVPRYLVGIAVDPLAQHESILEIFRLYSLTMRPLAQDKIDFPEEFECLLPATEHALKLMSLSELKAMSHYLNELQSQRLYFIQRLISALCQECSARVYQKPPFMEAMTLYDLALTMYPKTLPQTYHEIFSEYFLDNLSTASLSHRIKLMYSYSQNRRSSFAPLFVELLKSVTPHVSIMPLEMQGVVAHSVLKSGVTLQQDLPLLPELVPNLVNFLLSNCKCNELEGFSVQSEIELMRLSHFRHEDVTCALESFLISCNEENYLTMENMQCFLAFLASRNYNQMVFEKIEACLIKILSDETRTSLELTELARISWAMSAASHNCSSLFIEEVKKELHMQLGVDLVNRNLLKFVDALVSLAMMGHVDLELCRHAMQPPKGRAVGYGGHLEVKLVSRIASLRECLSIERPDVILPPPANRSVAYVAPKPGAQLHERPMLSKLLSELKAALASSSDVVLSFGCPLETIKLAGICLGSKHQQTAVQIEDGRALERKQIVSGDGGGVEPSESFAQESSRPSDSTDTENDARLAQCLAQLQRPVSLEVMDDTSTITQGRDGRRHTGMLTYKLRLMEKIGWKCVLIRKEDIETSDDVLSLVLDKIQHSCPEL